MKHLSLLSVLFLAITSCQKNVDTPAIAGESSNAVASESTQAVARPYKDNFSSSYQFVPDDGWAFPNPGPAFYPGKGRGHASYIGKAKTYFNSYVAGPPNFVASPSPVNLFFAKKLASYHVPNEANSVVVDENGNSIWFKATSLTQYPVSATRIEFKGTADIIGGSGKFKKACGTVAISGYFNPTDPSDAGVGSEGTIIF